MTLQPNSPRSPVWFEPNRTTITATTTQSRVSLSERRRPATSLKHDSSRLFLPVFLLFGILFIALTYCWTYPIHQHDAGNVHNEKVALFKQIFSSSFIFVQAQIPVMPLMPQEPQRKRRVTTDLDENDDDEEEHKQAPIPLPKLDLDLGEQQENNDQQNPTTINNSPQNKPTEGKKADAATPKPPPEGLVENFFDFYQRYSTEKWLEVLVVVCTNAFVFPLIIVALKINLPFMAVIGFGTFVTSTFYHTGETLFVEIFGMNYGRWHRLDNIFIILSLQQLFFFLCTTCPPNHFAWTEYGHSKMNAFEKLFTSCYDPSSDASLDNLSHGDGGEFGGSLPMNGGSSSNSSSFNLMPPVESDNDMDGDPEMALQHTYKTLPPYQSRKVRAETRRILLQQSKFYEWMLWGSLFFTLVCQEKAPWEEYYTFLPIIVPSVIVIARCLFLLESHLRPSYRFGWICAGVISLLLGLACFIKGLDNFNDYLRLWHGMWHVFGSLGFFCFFMGKKPLDMIELQKAIHEKMLLRNEKKVK
ncbi:hypothetical protein C9374_004783 [Naegleria lovaniensis]|uniref:Uncharacterized protein n=1 Tax=Naegleria lovaniensis TaxID=51637 RepID=A0AA88GKT7_NAELO|nr:uncharacterized protein C9374_004783 [Naegleria lovaniensis]KAG2382816.1 hypothetical protein C9374_004783 [Naegleria lovaniensis]